MLTGLSTCTTPFVDSHADGNRLTTLDVAASPSDISSQPNAVRLPTPRNADPNVGLASSVFVPSPASIVNCSPSRSTTIGTTSPGSCVRTSSPSSPEPSTVTPSTLSTMSPERNPASSAGPLSWTAISAPGRSTSSPRAAYTVNSRAMAISMCISEPAVMTSIRRG